MNDLGVDCISRDEAIQTIQKYGVGCFDADEFSPEECERFVISKLNELPTVTPQEPKTGNWNEIPKYKDIAWMCSECGRFTTMKHNYCPNCGAKMVEPQEI